MRSERQREKGVSRDFSEAVIPESEREEILSILADEKEMTEGVQRMSSARWTTDRVSSLFSLSFLFPPHGLFVCVQSLPLESFRLNDYNKIVCLICKGKTWIFPKCEIH